MSGMGVDGVQRRMAEIQARIDALAPARTTPAGGSSKAADAKEFADYLRNRDSGGLVGQIGPGGSTLEPMDPSKLLVMPTGDKSELRAAAAAAAQRFGLDPELFSALVEQESGFDPAARSKAGAVGLAQLMPETASALGVTNRLDPIQSLNGGARYLSQMMKRFNGDRRLALAAYNAGPGAVERAGGIPPYAETQDYVNRILSRVSRPNG